MEGTACAEAKRQERAGTFGDLQRPASAQDPELGGQDPTPHSAMVPAGQPGVGVTGLI